MYEDIEHILREGIMLGARRTQGSPRSLRRASSRRPSELRSRQVRMMDGQRRLQVLWGYRYADLPLVSTIP